MTRPRASETTAVVVAGAPPARVDFPFASCDAPEACAPPRGRDAGKPVAAICHGPWLLVEADLLRGRKATSWKSIRTDLKNAGAEVVDEEVVTDGNIITSRMPDDVPAFTDALIEAIEARA